MNVAVTTPRPRFLNGAAPGAAATRSHLLWVSSAVTFLGLVLWFALEDANYHAMASSVLMVGVTGVVYVSFARLCGISCWLSFFLALNLGSQFAIFVAGANGLIGGLQVGAASWSDKGWVQVGFSVTLVAMNAIVAKLVMGDLKQSCDFRGDFANIPGARREVEWVLFCCIPFSMAGPLTPLLPDGVAMLVKTFSFHVAFIPFFVGRYVPRSSPVFWVWIGELGYNAALGILYGGRFNAFFPAIAFAVGWRATLQPAAQRMTDIAALVGFFPFVLLIGALGVVRSEIGRDERTSLSGEHFSKLTKTLGQIAETRTEAMRLDVLTDGAMRLVPWSNYVVPLLSPNPVPYRGFSSFPSEVANAVMIYRFSDEAKEKLYILKMHAIAANDYGFAVQAGFAVEWGVLADGWSRGGWTGGALFLFVASALVYSLERWLILTRRFRPAFKIVLYSVILGRVLTLESLPLLEFMRQCILAIVLYVLLLYAIQSLSGHPGAGRPSMGFRLRRLDGRV